MPFDNQKKMLDVIFGLMFAVFPAVFVAGCSPAEQEQRSSEQNPLESGQQKPTVEETVSSADSTAKEDATEELKTFSRDGITAKIASWEQVQKFVAGQKGKIVVVDIWSTWCLPCVREYPQLVALQKKYPGKVVCVSFNINYDGSEKNPPESNVEELLDFYVKQKSDIQNFISSTPDEELYEKIKVASIPVAYVYAPDGTLKKRFDNEKKEYGDEGFTYEKQVIPLIEQMLKETP